MAYRYFDLIPTAIAHRGFTYPDGFDNGLENSMAAYQAAVDLGCKYIEVDIHGSRDGVPVISHDATLNRTTDQHGRIDEQDWEQIRTAKIRGQELIPRLENIFETWPDLRVNLHLKEDSAVLPVANAITEYDAFDRVGITSFSSERRRKLEAALPKRVAAGAGSAEMAELTAAAHLHSQAIIARALREVDCVQIPAGPAKHGPEHGEFHVGIIDREMINIMHKLGKFVHVWTINDPNEMTRLLDLGVDGIVTNRPDLLKQILEERGQWY
jgi:glycerophosphoryl diester phosphodiesterase